MPLRLNTLLVAEGTNPKVIAIAGSGFQEQRMVFPSFQVVYEDGAIIIDAVHTPVQHSQYSPNTPYSTQKFDLMQAAMRRSRSILATHEHFDHVGGISGSPYFDEISPKVHLTTAQINNAAPIIGFTPELLNKLTPFDYDKYYRAAPGLVLIKAAGHSPGGQMVYVRLQNGVEYLLVGDVVWNSENLDRLTGRPLLMSLMMGEDWEMHRHQVRTLYNMAHTEPIHLVISHDGEQIEKYIQQGVLGSSFE